MKHHLRYTLEQLQLYKTDQAKKAENYAEKLRLEEGYYELLDSQYTQSILLLENSLKKLLSKTLT